MRYQKSLAIEQRLNAALSLIQSGGYSTPLLAEELHVSIPTISRIIAALRERGHDIRAELTSEGWRYVMTSGSKRGKAVKNALANKAEAARSEQR